MKKDYEEKTEGMNGKGVRNMEEMSDQMFLIRPEILCGESLLSYLERLCSKNCYSNTSWILKLISTRPSQIQNNLFTEQDVLLLSHLTGQEFHELYKHSLLYWCSQLFGHSYEKYLLKNKVKYCPICIQEETVHQYIWGLQQVCLCITHKCELVDSCQACFKKVSHRELISGRCKECGFRYKDALIKYENIYSHFYQSQVGLQNAMFKKTEIILGKEGILFPKFLRLANASFHLLEGLYSFVDDQESIIRIFNNKKGVSLTNRKCLSAYANVWWMYIDFPNNFYRVLEVFVSKKSHSHMYSQKKQFERVLDEFPMIKEAYADFWVRKIDAGLARKDISIFKSEQALLEQRTTLRKEEVKALAGLSYGSIQHIVDAGKVQMNEVKRGKKTIYLIDRESLEIALKDADSYINKKEAADILGIQRESIVSLVKAGLLTEVQTPYASYVKIKIEEVNKLLQECREEPCKGEINGITFYEALIKFSVCGLSIERLLQFTLEGRIHPKSKRINGNLADNLYLESELRACIEQIKYEKQIQEGYYMTDVIKLLKIGEKKMWSLINKGIIVPDKIIMWKDGRKRYLFSKEQVSAVAKLRNSKW